GSAEFDLKKNVFAPSQKNQVGFHLVVVAEGYTY
ncbi:MAG: hypothetical protein HW407_2253, partial [Bacteroidetes bacterium]|nr:hypothetical protein [Bacteroidota bacterium]